MKLTTPTEQQEAEQLAAYLRTRRFDFTHIPNETGSDEAAKRRAMRMKRAGVSRGFPDYLIFAKGKMIAIELKRVKGAKASAEQVEWLEKLAGHGFHCAVCFGRDESVEFIEEVLGEKKSKKIDDGSVF